MLFYLLVLEFGLLTEYFETREKLKVALMTFEVSETEYRNVDNFFELTNYKWIFLKVKSNYSKILRNTQNFSVNIVFYSIYSQKHRLNLVQFVHFFMVNDSQKSWTICLISFSFEKIWKIKALFDRIVVIYWPMNKRIFPIENK